MKKLFAMLLAIAMLLSMAACVKPQDETVTYKDPYADLADDYDALSAAIYADVLGEFKAAYDAAKAATTVSERYALMAIAEAKLMESGVFLPLESNGGNYAISRVAPYTAPNVMWGNDSDRYHNVVVATTPIKPADRETMKAKYNELKAEYDRYSNGRMDEEEVATVTRTDVLNIVEKVVMPNAIVQEISITGNMLELVMHEITLEESSVLVTELEKEDLIVDALVSYATSEFSDEAEIHMTIYMRKVVE